MNYVEMLRLVFKVACQMAEKGPGWAQQSTVLQEAASRIPAAHRDLRIEQMILTCWHDLFRIGKLSWGYNLDNPDAPFFHVPPEDSKRSHAVGTSVFDFRAG